TKLDQWAAEVGLDQQFERLPESIQVEWLAQEREEASLLGGSDFRGIGEAGHQDRRQGANGGQLLQQFGAGRFGQVEVQQAEVEPMLAHHGHSLVRKGRRSHTPPLAGEKLAKTRSQGVVVFNQEDAEALGHGSWAPDRMRL